MLSALLVAVGAVVSVVGSAMGYVLLGEKARLIGSRTDLFILMSLVMIMWSQLSLMELFMERENRLYRQLPGFVLGAVVAALSVVVPSWGSADQLNDVLLFQGLGLGLAILWQFYQSGVRHPRWPTARLVVIAEMIATGAAWLLPATGWR